MNLSKNNEWLWNSRWTHWWLKIAGPGTENETCMEPTFSGPIDDDEILRRVKALQRANINAVLTEGIRGLIRFEHAGKTEAVIESIRKATQACHRAGIKVIHHTTTVFAGHQLSDFPVACREWLNIDAQTGTHAFINWAGDWYLWCINNPDFRAEYFRLSEKVIRETGVDGFMTDEVYFRTGWHNCACPHCREKYRKTTGFILPSGEADFFWGHFDNPAFRAWIRFRAASVGDFYEDLYVALRKAHSHPVLLGCKNSAEDPSHVPLFGDSNEERMRGVNLLFAELCSDTTSILYSWRRLSVCYMAYDGLSNYYGTPTMAIMYASPREGFISWAIMAAHGIRVWATSGGLSRSQQLLTTPKDMKLFTELFGWEEKHKDELTGAIRPLADIGVLFSASTRDMALSHMGPLGEAWYPYIREWAGWCETLTDEYVQYAMIVEPELTLSCLRQYALIILPNTTCMSDAACQAVVEYVAQGGNLIFTHEAGLCDETGSPSLMPEHRLGKLGINAGAGSRGSSSEQQVVRFGNHGLGKWVYFTHKPGRIVYAEANTLGTPRVRNALTVPIVFDEDQKLQKALMINAVRWATGDEFSLTVKEAPAGLLLKAFHQQNNKRRAVVVHLLNCRGEESVKFGEVIPEKEPIKFPSLENDIILELRLDSVKQAYLISPDWPGRKPVKFKRIDNVFHLTIPARTLKRYEVLYIFSA